MSTPASSPAMDNSVQGRSDPELHDARFAMTLSLFIGVFMLTHSAAIFSDMAESVVHVVAVAFAAFSLRLSLKPADPQFLYGYERITFFSAVFEGAMIVLAAITIIVASVHKWIVGRLENLGAGTLLIVAAGALNAVLGFHLLRAGRRTRSLILEAVFAFWRNACRRSRGRTGTQRPIFKLLPANPFTEPPSTRQEKSL